MLGPASSYIAFRVETAAVKLVKVLAGVETVLETRALAFPTDEYLRVRMDVAGEHITVWIDGIVVHDDVDAALSGSDLAAGTIALSASGSATPSRFDDVAVTRLTGLGELAETLLDEPFTTDLPSGWTFVDGTSAWAISATPHKLLDLRGLSDAVLSLAYTYELDA